MGYSRATPSFKYVPVVTCLDGLDLKAREEPNPYMGEDGLPIFTVTKEQYDKEYLTIFGPCFTLKDVWFPGSGALEAKTGMARMLVNRKPEVPGFHERLISNQTDIATKLRCGLHGFKKHFESRIKRDLKQDGFPKWLFQPHASRRARVEMAIINETFGHDFQGDRKNAEYGFKPGEFLAPEKKRCVTDLGLARTNATGWMWSSIKEAWSGAYAHGNYVFEFIAAPVKDKLKWLFEQLRDVPQGMCYMFYFSDDNTFAVRCSDGWYLCNGDIKQCDCSHYDVFLDLIRDFLRFNIDGSKNEHYECVTRAFTYLTKPLVFRNKHNKKEKVKYEFKNARMYTGFTGTTVVNNFASLVIGLSLQKLVPNPISITKAEFAKAYVQAAENVGYRVTPNECEFLEDAQFLKHSPVYVDGRIEVVMNMGAWVRGWGMFKGDLPGRGPLEARAKTFLSDVVESRANWGNHDFYKGMQKHCIPKKLRVRMTGKQYAANLIAKTTGEVGVYIPPEAICVRYRLPVDEFLDLCDQVSRATTQDRITHPAAQIMYNKDYA